MLYEMVVGGVGASFVASGALIATGAVRGTNEPIANVRGVWLASLLRMF